MNSEYSKLKTKILLQIIGIVAATAIFAEIIKTVFIDGVLQAPFARGFVNLCENYFFMSNDEAVLLYHRIFMLNKGTILTFGFILLLLIFVFVIMSRFTHYFNHISKGVDQLLEEGEKKIELKPELKELEEKLNIVKQTLGERKREALESEQRKNDLIVYLAHDLKTPLTSVIAYLNLLQEAPDMPADQRAKYTSISYQKALRLEELINEFFEITRFNLSAMVLEKEKMDLSITIEQLTDEFYSLFKEKNITATLEIDEGIKINGDGNKLARVFGNLLKNAAAYSYENSKVWISAKKIDESAVVTIRNEGKPIPAHKLETIFEKFYRVDDARTSNTGGAGLGLAIAKEIVELHNGSIEVRSDMDGTIFTVHLPALH